jgi:CubicO group peptidase (beta-lactamase class C family)
MKVIATLSLVCAGYFCPAQTISSTDIGAAFDKLIAESKPTEPGGVMLIAQKGQIIYKKAFGMANMEQGVPNQENTVFFIGSLTKQFTAVAILQLVEQGKLSLKDDIRKYIPDYNEEAGPIAIENLLTHTSGIASNADTTVNRGVSKSDMTTEKRINAFKNQPAEFAPGSKWSYNNNNYFILGYLIEKLSGQSYGDYVTEKIFKPAGMTSSCYCKEGTSPKNAATGYISARTGIRLAEANSIDAMFASGAIQSTVEDMYRWNQAIKSGILVKKATMARSFEPFRLNGGRFSNYGYAWNIENIQGSLSLRHGGLVRGFVAEAVYLPDEDLYAVLLTNAESKLRNTVVVRMIAAHVIGKPYNLSNEIAVDNKLMQTYTGVYENIFREKIIITEAGNKLYFQRPGGARYNILAVAKDEFSFGRDYLWVAFNRDSANRISKLSFSSIGVGATDWPKTTQPIPVMMPNKISDSLLQQYAGQYDLKEGSSITIVKEGSGLSVQVAGKEKSSTYAETESIFSAIKDNFRIAFLKNGSGQVDRLIWEQDKEKKEARRMQ